ncbi:MAG: hypothetical protein A2V77_24625 [Anaeromyxobacter sp. RBG_16_69_14]|nr:MAG: hypothetical protein A2V77_24625 [Anaeromyxobacter sp. RBG_16_69_14]
MAGKYFVHQLLGRGGMADVYKATQLGGDRVVALKILRASTLPDEGALRFQREIAAASRLRHRNSIEVLDFGTAEDGTIYLAMEFVPGRTLAHAIANEAPLAGQRAVHIAAQILEALGEAHALGIVHRDLKPANVMLDPLRDGTDFVKVVDFGIAMLRDQGSAEPRLTQQGMVYGTPAYMSPEQIRGEPLDARSDLYSVGVVLFELLTGALPFEAPSPIAVAARHLTDRAPRMAQVRPDRPIAHAIEALVARALEKDRALRPASAAAMRAAMMDTLTESERAPPRRELPATVLFRSSTVVAPARLETAAPSREPVPDRRRRALAVALALTAAALAAALPTALRHARARTQAHEEAPTPATIATPLAPATPASATDPPVATVAVPHPPAALVERPAPAAASAPRPSRGRPPPRREATLAIRFVRGELNSVSTPPAATGDGVLVLQATPWAEMTLDGKSLGETPREVRLQAGTYVVRAVHPEFGTREERVSVHAGERKMWMGSFAP